MMGEVADTLTARGANRLALKIQMFWSGLGVAVQAWVEPVFIRVDGKQETVFQVRSNLMQALADRAVEHCHS